MRTLTDDNGRQWTAVVGRESYGVHVILFMASGGGAAMQAPLDSETWLEAERELEALDDGELQQRLSGAWPWGESFTGD
ncbi:hypothetical protein [Arhodomonas sp. AD133]|uniref:hypothetical protein n=1 Tax=Arhodomonas sp. AD133 TaxID=3415009 RepID=UPI003EBE621D